MPKVKLANKDVLYLAHKSEELEAYIEWKATPKSERRPSSQEKLAPILGVTTRTLSNWNRDPRVIDKISKRALAQPLVDALPDVTASLIKIASDPSNRAAVSAAKAYFELLYRQTAAAESDELDMKSMTQAELERHVAELYDEVVDRGESKTA